MTTHQIDALIHHARQAQTNICFVRFHKDTYDKNPDPLVKAVMDDCMKDFLSSQLEINKILYGIESAPHVPVKFRNTAEELAEQY